MTSSPKSKLSALKRIITSSSASPPDPAPPPPADNNNSPTSPATTARTTKSWPEHDEVGESSRTAEQRGSSNPDSSSPASPRFGLRKSRFREDNGAVGAAAARRGSAFTEGGKTLVGTEETTSEWAKRRGWGGGGGGEEGEKKKVEDWRARTLWTAEGEEQREDEEGRGLERRREQERRWEEEERRRGLGMRWGKEDLEEDEYVYEKGPGFVEDVVAVLRKMVHKKDRKGKGVGVCRCCPQRKRSYRKFMETPEAWWKATRP